MMYVKLVLTFPTLAPKTVHTNFIGKRTKKRKEKRREKDENKMLEKLKTSVGCYSQFSYYAHNTIDKYMRGYVVYPNMP